MTSDDDYLTAEANSNAFEGNHSVQIRQLATSDRWVHDGFEYKTSYVGEGYFIFSYNHQELVVQTTAETTLEGLVGLINNNADNPGVNASILKYDDGQDGVYHLVLSGQESGSDYQITVNASNTEVLTADSGLDRYHTPLHCTSLRTRPLLQLQRLGQPGLALDKLGSQGLCQLLLLCRSSYLS